MMPSWVWMDVLNSSSVLHPLAHERLARTPYGVFNASNWHFPLYGPRTHDMTHCGISRQFYKHYWIFMVINNLFYPGTGGSSHDLLLVRFQCSQSSVKDQHRRVISPSGTEWNREIIPHKENSVTFDSGICPGSEQHTKCPKVSALGEKIIVERGLHFMIIWCCFLSLHSGSWTWN